MAGRYNYSQNQVFATHDFVRLANALQDAQVAGDGAVALLNMTTVSNARWAIPAGRQVQMCWIYVGRTLNWENNLRPELKKLVVPEGAAADPSVVMDSGPFKHFPNYPTDHLQLTNQQANLLADLVGWLVLRHQTPLRELLRGRLPAPMS